MNLFTRIMLVLFLISGVSSFIFYTFLSDRAGFSDKQEQQIAAIINREFKKGDIIFPQPDWDIGFTRYLLDGILDISYTLHAYSSETIADLNNNGKNDLLFVLDDASKWNALCAKLKLKERQRWDASGALVIAARPAQESTQKLFDFVDDLPQAREVYFMNPDGRKEPCDLKGSRWQCSNNDWNYIGPERALMGGMWQRANWAHPRTMKTLHVVFNSLPEAKKVVLGSAFLERAYANPNGEPAEVAVHADGTKIISYTNKSINKYYRTEANIPANTKTIDITVFIRFDGARHFVFNGYLAP